MNRSILLIEDTLKIKNAIKLSLEKEGFLVYACSSAETGLKTLEKNKINLILLDLMLPNMTGEEFLTHLGSSNKIPIIIISALDDEFTQINLYNKRIDDFVVKPFSINILSLKINAILRRTEQKKDLVVRYDDLVLEVNNYRILFDNVRIDVTPREFEIVQIMLLNQDRIFSREEFIDILWGYNSFIDSRTVDVHIKNLRKKLGKSLIKTVKGIGYRIEKKQKEN